MDSVDGACTPILCLHTYAQSDTDIEVLGYQIKYIILGSNKIYATNSLISNSNRYLLTD